MSRAVDSFTTSTRIWNKEVFGNLFSRKKRVEAHLRWVQTAIAVRPNAFLIDLDSNLRRESAEIKCLEEEF